MRSGYHPVARPSGIHFRVQCGSAPVMWARPSRGSIKYLGSGDARRGCDQLLPSRRANVGRVYPGSIVRPRDRMYLKDQHGYAVIPSHQIAGNAMNYTLYSPRRSIGGALLQRRAIQAILTCALGVMQTEHFDDFTRTLGRAISRCQVLNRLFGDVVTAVVARSVQPERAAAAASCAGTLRPVARTPPRPMTPVEPTAGHGSPVPSRLLHGSTIATTCYLPRDRSAA